MISRVSLWAGAGGLTSGLWLIWEDIIFTVCSRESVQLKFYVAAGDGQMDLHQLEWVVGVSGGNKAFLKLGEQLMPVLEVQSPSSIYSPCVQRTAVHSLWCILTLYRVLDLASSLRDSISGQMSPPSMPWSEIVRAAETPLLELCGWGLWACQLLSLFIANPACCADLYGTSSATAVHLWRAEKVCEQYYRSYLDVLTTFPWGSQKLNKWIFFIWKNKMYLEFALVTVESLVSFPWL